MAACRKICPAVSKAKSANIRSDTVRAPVAEAPTAAAVKPCSEIGVSTMRSRAELLPEVLGVGEAAAALAGAFAEIEDAGLARISSAMPSRTASSQPCSRASRRPRCGRSASGGLIGSAKTCMPHRCRIGLGRVAGELQRVLHDLLDLRLDLGERLGVGDAIVLEQTLAEHVDRVALDPGVDFLLRPIGADDRVALVVADGAVGLGLDQRRPLAGAGALGRLLHRQPDREDVVAVDRDARHAVGCALVAISGLSVIDLQRRRGRVEVVLADEHRRRLLHRGEVQPLVEAAVVGGAVAEEGDADVVGPALPGAHADADGMADAGSDDAVGAEQPDRAVVEMHGAAAAAADAVRLAEQLGHDAAGIGALGERMAVAAMRRGHPVGRPQMRADADARRFLADDRDAGSPASRPCGRRSAQRSRSGAAAPSARRGRAGRRGPAGSRTRFEMLVRAAGDVATRASLAVVPPYSGAASILRFAAAIIDYNSIMSTRLRWLQSGRAHRRIGPLEKLGPQPQPKARRRRAAQPRRRSQAGYPRRSRCTSR